MSEFHSTFNMKLLLSIFSLLLLSISFLFSFLIFCCCCTTDSTETCTGDICRGNSVISSITMIKDFISSSSAQVYLMPYFSTSITQSYFISSIDVNAFIAGSIKLVVRTTIFFLFEFDFDLLALNF